MTGPEIEDQQPHKLDPSLTIPRAQVRSDDDDDDDYDYDADNDDGDHYSDDGVDYNCDHDGNDGGDDNDDGNDVGEQEMQLMFFCLRLMS